MRYRSESNEILRTAAPLRLLESYFLCAAFTFAHRAFWASEMALRPSADIFGLFLVPAPDPDPWGRPAPRLPRLPIPEPPNARGNGTSATR